MCSQHIYISEFDQLIFLDQHNCKDISKAILAGGVLHDILVHSTPNFSHMSTLLSAPLH